MTLYPAIRGCPRGENRRRHPHVTRLPASALLLFAGDAIATTVSLGAGGSPVERLGLGILFGLAGGLPGTAAVFALLNAMFCHPARSTMVHALLGALLGCVAYALCVLIGSLSLGVFLDGDNLMQGYARYGEAGFWWLVFIVLFLPAVPLVLWSVLHARSAPAVRAGDGDAQADAFRH